VTEDGEDRREKYRGDRGFGNSSGTGEVGLATDGVSSASDRSSMMARGGGRSTSASSNLEAVT
jgi:hypothetical protein